MPPKPKLPPITVQRAKKRLLNWYNEDEINAMSDEKKVEQYRALIKAFPKPRSLPVCHACGKRRTGHPVGKPCPFVQGHKKQGSKRDTPGSFYVRQKKTGEFTKKFSAFLDFFFAGKGIDYGPRALAYFHCPPLFVNPQSRLCFRRYSALWGEIERLQTATPQSDTSC
jgi:hypothetical protein